MIEKIKKLVESTNYDDNRLALILIAENYDLEELFDSSNNSFDSNSKNFRYLYQFGINKDKEPNGLILDNGFSLYFALAGPVGIDKAYAGPIVENGIGFIRWELNKKQMNE